MSANNDPRLSRILRAMGSGDLPDGQAFAGAGDTTADHVIREITPQLMGMLTGITRELSTAFMLPPALAWNILSAACASAIGAHVAEVHSIPLDKRQWPDNPGFFGGGETVDRLADAFGSGFAANVRGGYAQRVIHMADNGQPTPATAADADSNAEDLAAATVTDSDGNVIDLSTLRPVGSA